MRYQKLMAFAAGLVLAPAAYADASYEETAQLTGGTMKQMMGTMGMFSPSSSSQLQKADSKIIAVSGNRKAEVSPKMTIIWDLDKETLTRVDTVKKQYAVATFAEIQKQAEEAATRARQLIEEHKGDPNPALPPELANNPASYDAKAEDTGAKKNISGLDTHEVLLTLSMKFQSPNTNDTVTYYFKKDVWLASTVPPGWQEIQNFDKRLAEKFQAGMTLYGGMAPLLAARPGLAEGLKKIGEEERKQQGVGVMVVQQLGGRAQGDSVANAQASTGTASAPGQATTMTNEVVAGTASGAAEKEASQLSSSGNMGILSSSLLSSAVNVFQKHSAQLTQSATSSATNAVSKPSNGKPATVDNVMYETTTVLSNFSTETVPASAFAVPAGFTKVDWQGPMRTK
jgi:hypothetical protein